MNKEYHIPLFLISFDWLLFKKRAKRNIYLTVTGLLPRIIKLNNRSVFHLYRNHKTDSQSESID